MAEKTVKIPGDLYKEIEDRCGDSDFKSVDEYVTYVLKEVVSGELEEEQLGEDDEKKVQERLKDLGYID